MNAVALKKCFLFLDSRHIVRVFVSDHCAAKQRNTLRMLAFFVVALYLVDLNLIVLHHFFVGRSIDGE